MYSGVIQYSQGTAHEEERPKKESVSKDEDSGVRESKPSTGGGGNNIKGLPKKLYGLPKRENLTRLQDPAI